MIAGGMISGGEPGEPVQALPGFSGAGVALGSISETKADAFIGDATLKDILGQQSEMFYGGMIGQGVSQLISTIGNSIMSWMYFDAQTEINDRRMLATENISDNQTEVQLAGLKVAGEANARMYGPNGAARELAQIDANKQVALFDRKAQAAENISAMRNVDEAFGLGGDRGSYDHGNPVTDSPLAGL